MTTRIISASVGIAILLAVFWLSDTIVLPLAMGIVTLIILYELSKAVNGEKFHLAMTGMYVYGIVYMLSIYVSFLDYYDGDRIDMLPVIFEKYVDPFLMPACLTCLFLEFLWHHGKYKVEMLGFMASAMLLVPWSLGKLVWLRHHFGDHGLFYLILALCGAWIADSGAYFVGISMGKHKLCPNISPKKTVEGFIGGLISNAVVFVLIFWGYAAVRHVDFDVLSGLKVALLGLVCAGISVVGDLTASVIKREKGIKDYGNIMPGHGGLMDRFDSVLFVVPAFDLVMKLFPIFTT